MVPYIYHLLFSLEISKQPFSRLTTNPSWSCTKPLHNTVIRTSSGAKIHCTALGPLHVSYDAVLKLLPIIYDHPPRLPNPTEATEIIDPSEPMPAPENFAAPPKSGYDFIFHVGAGSNGAAFLEQIGHKTGYKSPDVDGNYAPHIHDAQPSTKSISEAEKFERERLGSAAKHLDGQVTRGFGTGYENFPEELKTEVDVASVISGLKRSGETVSRGFSA